MSVLDREALEASPLADLHTIASELSIDGYRRIRRGALIDAILERQGGANGAPEPAPSPAPKPRRARKKAESPQDAEVAGDAEGVPTAETLQDAEAPSDTSTPRDAEMPPEAETAADAGTQDQETDGADREDRAGEEEDEQPPRRRRGRRGGRARTSAREEAPAAEREERPEEPAGAPEDEIVEGVVELLPNGSGFVRVAPPEPSDEDVYISAAQVKRCELVSGDRITGPRRPPRRSERFASLVRIDTINDRPAEEVADNARFDDLPAAFPAERFRLGSEDPTIKAIEWLTPFGRGSRVTITGPSRAGKSEALRRLAAALTNQEDLQLSLALVGVRPEEIGEWNEGPLVPTAAVSFALSPDAQASAVELVVDQARRVAARGSHAVVLIDTLDGLHPLAARRALAAARNLVEGGSLTVIATSSEPIGGETTVIALDLALTSSRRFPAVDLVASGTIRPELLVGEAAADAIAGARAEALNPEDD